MINYGKILKMHEKDNPSSFCRASYLVSNIGDIVKCYGRMLRFPDDAHIYQKEMELAMGDVLMQCRLIEEEHIGKHHTPDNQCWDTLDGSLITIMYLAGQAMDHMERGTDNIIIRDGYQWTTEKTINGILDCLGNICTQLELDINRIEHLGFIHTFERFEQFEKEGWK